MAKKPIKKEGLNAQKGELPEKKNQITKAYMKEYIKYQANTPENIQWFLALCKKHEIETKTANGTNKTYDVVEVRKEFIDKFFKDTFEKKETKKSYYEELEDFFKD